jgi:hypothetical protein
MTGSDMTAKEALREWGISFERSSGGLLTVEGNHDLTDKNLKQLLDLTQAVPAENIVTAGAAAR